MYTVGGHAENMVSVVCGAEGSSLFRSLSLSLSFSLYQPLSRREKNDLPSKRDRQTERGRETNTHTERERDQGVSLDVRTWLYAFMA